MKELDPSKGSVRDAVINTAEAVFKHYSNPTAFLEERLREPARRQDYANALYTKFPMANPQALFWGGEALPRFIPLPVRHRVAGCVLG